MARLKPPMELIAFVLFLATTLVTAFPNHPAIHQGPVSPDSGSGQSHRGTRLRLQELQEEHAHRRGPNKKHKKEKKKESHFTPTKKPL